MLFSQKNENRLTEIAVTYILPNKAQPRKVFNEDELNLLSKSIAKNGILQPLTVRRISPIEYELIAGERRLRAAIMAGFDKVPCIIMKCSDNQSAIFALIENLQREDLNMFEEAFAIKRLVVECRMTQEQIARQLGKNQSTVANKIRLLKINDEQQQIIINNNLSERHARTILKLDDDNRLIALDRIVKENLNVNQTEILVNDILNNNVKKKKENKNQRIVIKDVRIFINTFMKAFDTMKQSGINAISKKTEDDEFIEYSVKIPKNTAYSNLHLTS
ncbi:MAG: ParB/RepB/Spo0J family partition protein [Acutalibacteraceae bacterium]